MEACVYTHAVFSCQRALGVFRREIQAERDCEEQELLFYIRKFVDMITFSIGLTKNITNYTYI